MPKIIAVCGKICSGKTYYANRIRKREHAVLLSCDALTKVLFDNDLGDRHDDMAVRIHAYLRERSVDIIRAGCNVIHDWGFWTKEERASISAYYRERSIPCEWHYIDVDDAMWQRNIAERNARILSGDGGSDYYLDEGLLQKLLSRWETPTHAEIDVRIEKKSA